MRGEIVPFRYTASDLKIEFEELPKDNLNLTATRTIYNAWDKGAKIDKFGRIWVNQKELHIILRTTKANVRDIGLGILPEYKTQEGEETYIKGSEICRLLNDVIENNGQTILRRNYARFSEQLYRIIRDSEQAELLRCKYWETVNTVKKKLKQTRIKRLKIERDELTNCPLQNNSEFSHIRKASIHVVIADQYWNGLIVNKNTHEIITQREINDEDQLLELCHEKNWNTEWFSVFCESLQSFDS